MGISFRLAAFVIAMLLLIIISGLATAGTPPTPGQTITPMPSNTPAPTATPGPTATPEPTATPMPTATPSPTPGQPAPSSRNTWQYSNTPAALTATPAPAATAVPSPSLTPANTVVPTAVPSPVNNGGFDTNTMIVAAELMVIAAMGGFILGKRKK